MARLKVLFVSPAPNKSVPLTGTKSTLGVAEPLNVLRNWTAACPVAPPVRKTEILALPLPTTSLTL